LHLPQRRAIKVIRPGILSRLLARLAGMGLIVNRRAGPGRANVWRLTERGELVAKALTRDRGDSLG